MKKRLFIAIDLPGEIKDKIEKEIEKIRYDFTGDVRFLDRENWHVTLVFLGYQPDEAAGPILESLKEIGKSFSPQTIEIESLSYGPIGKSPRMIWINGSAETAKKLGELKNKLEESLVQENVVFQREKRQFKIHITIARFNDGKQNELPKIDKKLNLKFSVESVDLMESQLSRSGAKYELLQKTNFKLK